MLTVTLRLSNSGVALGPVKVAKTMWHRTRGLLGRPSLQNDEGMLLMRCNSVHTVGMRYPIDVVFLDSDGTVARVVEGLKPLRFAGCWKASVALELAAGRARALNVQPGTKITGW